MTIEVWAENLVGEVANEWRSLKGMYTFWESGFSVFYSPVYSNPDLMIIGYNPGGGKNAFNESEAMRIPSDHEYFVENYRLANMMKTIFGKIGKIDLLEKSVKCNLIFFRSTNKNEFMSINEKTRKEMEAFCFKQIKEIIVRLNPKLIITEGMQTYDVLLKLLQEPPLEIHCLPEISKLGENGRRAYCSGDCDIMKLIGVLHLSGARPRPTKYELDLITKALGKDIEQIKEIEEARKYKGH